MSSLSITVAIATFNRSGLLGRAIQSVLDQNWPGVEIVVVDDASNDGTLEFVAYNFPNVRYFRQDQNQGCGAARNRALQEAFKQYVLILDDDDTLLPGALALIAARMATVPDLRKYPVVNFARGNARLDAPYVLARFEDYISEVLQGDFVPIICRELFLREKLMYPLSRVGGEHLLWWNIAERFGIPTWADRVGTVNTDAPIRLSSVRSQIRHAREHAEVQERTLEEFGEIICREFSAYYAKKLLGAAAYRVLAGDRSKARSHLRTAFQWQLSGSAAAVWVLSFMPLSLVKQCFLTYRCKNGGGGMRVLQVIDSLALGGAEVLVSGMYMGFRERGINCEYYLLRAEQTPIERKLASQGGIIHAPLEAPVYSARHIWALQKHLRAFEYDIVHVHLFPAQLWAACGARLAGKATPLVTTEHNTENRRRKRWYRGIDRWMYGQYQRIASISPATTANLVKWLPEVQDKVVECPNGINFDAFASASRSGKEGLFSLPESTIVVLCVASLDVRKGHDTLLRAVSLVPEIALVLVGDGPLSRELHNLADELGIASRVQFLGKRMDVPQLLKAADLYVQPSRVDGFGIAALEAMAAGKPIVASNIPGLADVVGDAGLLFPAGDAGQLAQRITTLLGDAGLRQRLAHSAQQRARTFGLEKTLDCYEQLYQDVMRDTLLNKAMPRGAVSA